jgi:hypothetical protein
LHAHEPLLEASIEMAGKLAPGRQSSRGVNAGADVHQPARIRSLLSRLPCARLRGLGAASLRCLAGRGSMAGRAAIDG